MGFGLFLAAVYFCFGLKKRKERNIEDVMGVFGYAVGIFGGIQVCWAAYAERTTPPIEKISLQMFAGGLALVLFAINKLVKKFQEN